MPDTIELAEGAQPAEQPRVRVSSPASLLAVIPPLLGFEPSEASLVVIGTEPSSAEVRITIRIDIPEEARLASAVASEAVGYLADNCITTAAVVGYGPDCLVDPTAGSGRARSVGSVTPDQGRPWRPVRIDWLASSSDSLAACSPSCWSPCRSACGTSRLLSASGSLA